jgi:hypothetical protein
LPTAVAAGTAVLGSSTHQHGYGRRSLSIFQPDSVQTIGQPHLAHSAI